MSRTNSISAVDALGTFIDTLRDLGYTPDEVKGALILYASPMPAPRARGPLTEGQAVACVAKVYPVVSRAREFWQVEHDDAVAIVREVEKAHGIGTPTKGVDHG